MKGKEHQLRPGIVPVSFIAEDLSDARLYFKPQTQALMLQAAVESSRATHFS